jgi:hypothetical protein
MDRILTISDTLYKQLEALASRRGLHSIEQLLETLPEYEKELHQRRTIVHEIDALRERLTAIYGEMPDSTDFIRDDRAR